MSESKFICKSAFAVKMELKLRTVSNWNYEKRKLAYPKRKKDLGNRKSKKHPLLLY